MTKKPKNKSTKHVVTDRDEKIFRSLWKWKALSTHAIARKFFPSAIPFTAYIRLLELENAGYIQTVRISGRGFEIWCLTPKGFKFIRPKMIELHEDGFKSENYHHDYIATAFHLGEWLTGQPSKAQTFSEQQLRRISEEHWPAWIPQSTLHRPDGYSLYQKDRSVIVSFETELSPKTKSRYERVVTFYDNQASIDFVFWLIKSQAILTTMRDAFQKCGVSNWSKHHFVLLADFQAKGWMAPFIEGQFKGYCPKDFLGSTPPTKALQSPNYSSSMSLLDTRRRPIFPSVCQKTANAQIID